MSDRNVTKTEDNCGCATGGGCRCNPCNCKNCNC